MSARSFWRLGIVLVVAASLVACNGAEEEGPPLPADDPAISTEPGVAPPSEEDTGEEAVAATETPHGRISSGEVERPPTKVPPERPTAEAGIRRIVSIDDAMEGATFTLLEIKDLPEDSHRDVVYLETPYEDETSPILPAVRFVYDTGAGSAIVMYQHPATGDEAPGEAVEIGSYSGWLVSEEPPVVIWEQDGVRIELRGKDIDLQTVLTAAASVAPIEAEAE